MLPKFTFNPCSGRVAGVSTVPVAPSIRRCWIDCQNEQGNYLCYTLYQLSNVNPAFTVTCQRATLLSSSWPRTSATLNQLILRIVFPARLVALFTAFSTPSEEEPTSSIFLLGVVTHEHIESFQVVSGEHISRFRGPSSNSTNKGHRDSVCVESAHRGSNRPPPRATMYRKRKQNRTAGMFRF